MKEAIPNFMEAAFNKLFVFQVSW